ncbi:hypothetical protein ACO0LL_17890 [Undibacterium sp. TC4M20W]|uniref:hypothetical protein n=1 Tax=unclassified Undibacterium TaxID=2630295 RepID=UPI003BF00051
MRIISNEELLDQIGGGIDTVTVTGQRMTPEEKDEYDQQQAREAADTIRRETRGTTG